MHRIERKLTNSICFIKLQKKILLQQMKKITVISAFSIGIDNKIMNYFKTTIKFKLRIALLSAEPIYFLARFINPL